MLPYSIEIADDPRYFSQRKYVIYRGMNDLCYCNSFNDARRMLALIRLTDTIFYGLTWGHEELQGGIA